jgi:hypothetical protein
MCCAPTSSCCLPRNACSATTAVLALTDAIAALKRCSRSQRAGEVTRQRALEVTRAQSMRCKHPQRGSDCIAMNSCGRGDAVSIKWKHINTPECFAAAARILCASISSASSFQKFRKRFAPGKQGVHGDEIHRKMECKIWREIELRHHLWCRAPACQAGQKAALNPVVTVDQLLRSGQVPHATPHVTHSPPAAQPTGSTTLARRTGRKQA